MTSPGKMFGLLLLLCFFACCHFQTPAPCTSPEVVFAWSRMEYVWPNETFSRRYSRVASRRPIGIKVHEDKVYMTIPRWAGDSFPVNLVVADRPAHKGCGEENVASPKLRPYPNLESQKLDDCTALQYVQSMEIEPNGVMWMPDNGRQLQFFRPQPCKPKLVLMDVKTDQVIKVHHFPADVVSKSSSFLNDISLDVSDPDDKFAYISDSNIGAIVVYSLKLDKSWKAEHLTMKADPKASSFDFLNPPGHRTIRNNHVNGIAASPARTGTKYVFFNPLTSFSLFQVESRALKNENIATSGTEFGQYAVEHKNKPSQSDGLTMNRDGDLYVTEIVLNSISAWRPPSASSTSTDDDLGASLELIAQDNTTMIWPDTLAMDEQGFLWTTTRDWPIDKGVNRVVRIYVGTKSYLHP